MPALRTALTTGIVYVRDLLLSAGTGSSRFSPGGIILYDNTAVATDDGTLKTLISFSLPAGTLANDGDSIEIEALSVLANDTDLKLTAITFGGTVVSTRSGVADQALRRYERAVVTRTGATTQEGFGMTIATGNGPIYTVSAPAETLSGAITIALKGQNQTDTTAASVTSIFMRVTYWPIGSSSNLV